MENPATAKHLGYLDGLRAVAAVYVLLCHAFLEVDLTHQSLSNLAKFFLQFFFFGHFAVDLFIVLSGFCLMLPVLNGRGTLRGGALRFLGRRAWRIIPPYYCALALSLSLIWLVIGQKTGTHWDISIPVTGQSILVHLLLIQDLVGYEASINHVFWSISVEWRIYFLFPLLLFCCRRYGAAATATLAVVVSFVLLQLCNRYVGSTLAAHYIGLFAMGMFGADIAFANDQFSTFSRRLPWGLITSFMTLAVFMMFFPGLWDGPHARVYVADYVVGVWATALLVAVSCNERGWLCRFLNSRPLVFTGTFAYSIYLIHAPLLQVLWQYAFAPLQTKPLQMFAALSIVGTPMIIGASYAFFLACERPFLRAGRKRTTQTLQVAGALQPAP